MSPRWQNAVMGGQLMAKEEEYRQRADECLNLANQIDSREARAFLLRMAEAWLHLADEERPSGPARQKRLRPLRKGQSIQATAK
jgi:hypothetical protein